MANTIAGVTPGLQVLAGFRRDPHVWSLVAESDIVELGWAWYLAFLPDVRRVDTNVPITAFEHDVLTESLFRRARDGYAHERTLGRIQAMRARSREPELLNRCDAVFTFSDRDRRVLQDLGVRSHVVVVDPFIESRPAADPTDQPPTVLFVGAMDRPENHQGASWVIEEVWPTIGEACPDARLVIAGTSPPQALMDLAGGQVEVTGYVADLQPLYLGTSVFVAPNLTGAGVKFKVLDAMSYGLPVVATPVAAEGIVEECGPEVFGGITVDAREMASLVIGLLQDPAQARALGEKARTRVRERYDFTRTVSTVLNTYRELTGR